MLNLILGRAGSGKTEDIIEYIRQNIDSKKLMLIVPEQYSFETERRLLRELGSSKAIDVQVLSFTRLSARIFRDCGGLAGRYIDDAGRNILMSATLEQVKDHLTLYAGQAMIPAFASTMVQTVGEFKMCGVSLEVLETAIKMQEQVSLKQKLQELSLIMSTYDALIANSFNDSLDDLTRLAKKLDEFNFFSGYTVMFDGFTSFTPQENKVITHIIKQSEDVFVSLCAPYLIDNDEGMGLFSPVLETAQSLLRVARKYDVKVSQPVILTPSKRYHNEALKHLESWLFRNSTVPFNDISSEINLLRASTIFEEVEYVACSIRKLVREKGYRYRDIVVIARNISIYKGILDAVFKKYDIPIFMDRRQELDGKPLFALVLAALDIISKGWRREDVLRYLKTGLTGLLFEDISLFENYTYMYNIRGTRFCSEFKSHPRGYIKDMNEEDRLILARINEIRVKIVEPLQEFGQKLKNSDGRHISKAIYELLMELDCANRIKEMAEAFYNSGELLISDEYLRLWDMLMDTLDQFSIALAGVRCSAKRCSELMRLVISGLDIGSIPPSIDEVVAGSADRIRVGGVKAAFIIGVNEGVFPQVQSINGIFSDNERQALIDSGLNVAPGSINQAIEEMFIAYSAICSASDEVYLTYSLSDISGGSLRQSYIIPMIKRLFPNLKQLDINDIELEQRVENEQSAFGIMAANWNSHSKFIIGLKEYFKENELYSDKYHALLRAVDRKPASMYDRSITRELFGKNMRLSPTRLEQFHQCKFAYFCKYGLKALPKKKASLEAPEIGTLIHFVMENMIASTMDKGIDHYSQKELKSMVRKLLNEYITDYMGGSEEKSARFKYLFNRLANLVDILVQQIVDELSQSQFTPVDFELLIGTDGDIEPFELKTFDGGSIQVEGKVDRVDVMHKRGKAYVRIVDYKTGSKDFSLSDVLYGLNMQMLIYLFTIWQNGKERYGDIIPCGVLYMPAIRPIADVDRNADETEAESKRKSKLKMKGILLDDPEVIHGMEAEAKGIFIPASIKSDGSISATSNVATLEQLGIIKRHIENLLYKLSDTLYEGDISAIPIKGGINDPCKYCDYMAVCGFEEGKTTIKNLVKFKDNELFEMMKSNGNEECNL